MANICVQCNSEFNSRSPGVSCSGPCKKAFHFACANLPPELPACMKKCKRIYWKCEDCQNYSAAFNISDLQSMIDEKFQQFTKTLADEIEQKLSSFKSTLSNEIAVNTSKNIMDNLGEDGSFKVSTSYAEVAQTSLQSKILVKPKNCKQDSRATKFDIMQSADPVKNDVKVKKVKAARNGSVVLECKDNAESKKLMGIMKEDMEEKYTITELTSIMPSVRISGLSQTIDKEAIGVYLAKQNDGLFSENSLFEVVSIEPFKKNKNLFNISAKCDAVLYKKLLDRSYVLIGIDGCSVHDAFTIRRCYNCNGYNHFSKVCPVKNVTCPICAGEHSLKDCKAPRNSYRCSNCTQHNEKHHSDFATNHAVWDYENCECYIQNLSKVKQDLFGIRDPK